MLVAVALGLAIAKPESACAPDAIRSALDGAGKALEAKDFAAARQALAAPAACPVRDGPSYAAHVLRAELALRDGDWLTARAMLAGTGVHPEHGMSGRAGFARLRADQGLGDAHAFTVDRDAMLAADDRRLGGKVESFPVPGGRVDAYRVAVNQGAFHRVLEFIGVPDDPAAYPASILLTDDVSTGQIMALLDKDKAGAGSGHAWFLDLYTCGGHSTLAPIGPFNAATAPAYADVKARVLTVFTENKPLAAAAPPAEGSCGGATWILPALGGHLSGPAGQP